jgi:hypothetical protein
MAVPHYAYLKMKLSGPRGVITVTGCYKKSIECARASSKLVEALIIAEKKHQLLQWVAAVQPGHPASSQPASPSPQAGKHCQGIPAQSGQGGRSSCLRGWAFLKVGRSASRPRLRQVKMSIA